MLYLYFYNINTTDYSKYNTNMLSALTVVLILIKDPSIIIKQLTKSVLFLLKTQNIFFDIIMHTHFISVPQICLTCFFELSYSLQISYMLIQ